MNKLIISFLEGRGARQLKKDDQFKKTEMDAFDMKVNEPGALSRFQPSTLHYTYRYFIYLPMYFPNPLMFGYLRASIREDSSLVLIGLQLRHLMFKSFSLWS